MITHMQYLTRRLKSQVSPRTEFSSAQKEANHTVVLANTYSSLSLFYSARDRFSSSNSCFNLLKTGHWHSILNIVCYVVQINFVVRKFEFVKAIISDHPICPGSLKERCVKKHFKIFSVINICKEGNAIPLVICTELIPTLPQLTSCRNGENMGALFTFRSCTPTVLLCVKSPW